MQEPAPKDAPSVVHVKVFGVVARNMQSELQLPRKQEDRALSERFSKESSAESAARSKAGYNVMVGQRHPLDEGEKPGVSNVNIGVYIEEMFAAGYFLIAATYEQELVGETKRDQIRFVFSSKEEDRSITVTEPSQEKLKELFHGKIFAFLHYHDNRRHHPGLDKEVGNVSVDLAGRLQDTRHCKRYKKLHMVDREPRVELEMVHVTASTEAVPDPVPIQREVLSAPLGEALKRSSDSQVDLNKLPPLKQGQKRFVFR